MTGLIVMALVSGMSQYSNNTEKYTIIITHSDFGFTKTNVLKPAVVFTCVDVNSLVFHCLGICIKMLNLKPV